MEAVADLPPVFTLYTGWLTVLLSFTWGLAALPALSPSYVSPPASGVSLGNSTPLPDFYTVIEEFSLDAHTAEWTTSAYFAGTLLLGQIPCAYSDRVGRHPILLFSLLCTAISSVVCAFAPSYSVFLVGRFVQGGCYTSLTSVGWVLLSESVPFSCHGRASLIFGIMWAMGYCSLTPLALLFPTWRGLFLASAVPTIVLVLLVKFTVRESLSFLIAHRRIDEAKSWIENMGKINGKKYDTSSMEGLMATREEEEEETLAMWRLGRKALGERAVSLHLSICIYMWTTDFLVYNGLSMTSTGIKGADHHLSFLASGLVEVPAAILLPISLDLLGRRWSVILTHGETALALVVMAFLPQDSGLPYLIVRLLAKFGIAASFFALYIYGSEIFPIQYRNLCIGLCCSIGNIGAMAAPLSAHAALSHPALVLFFFAAVSIVSGVLTVFLPETMHGEGERREGDEAKAKGEGDGLLHSP